MADASPRPSARPLATTVELDRVTKTYGPVRALVGVSASFAAGEVTVVAGPNGSGKSTLLGVVGTLVRPTSGAVRHGALGRTRGEVRRTLGWVGHEALVYPDLSGRENVELAARLFGLDVGEAFRRAEARFGLGAWVDRPFRTCSRGQRQRIVLARALGHAPGLVLLDEPTTGLDRVGVELLVRVTEEEAARGAVVVVVTHDQGFAEACAARTVTLERGRVVGA